MEKKQTKVMSNNKLAKTPVKKKNVAAFSAQISHSQW